MLGWFCADFTLSTWNQKNPFISVLPKEYVTQFQTGCVQSCKNQNGDDVDDWGAGRCEEEMCIGIPY